MTRQPEPPWAPSPGDNPPPSTLRTVSSKSAVRRLVAVTLAGLKKPNPS